VTALRCLLDTHACLALIGGGAAAAAELRSLFEQCAPGEVAISSLTLAALRARAQNSRSPEQNRRALDQFVLPLAVVDFNAEAAQWLGKIAAEVAALGRSAGPEEMLAAQALCLNVQLVTSRPHFYKGIAALQLTAIGSGSDTTASAFSVGPAADPSIAVQEVLSAPAVIGTGSSMWRTERGAQSLNLNQGQIIRVAGSHDFTLDLLARWLQERMPGLTLSLDSVGSLRGLLALQQGTAHLAGSHLLDVETGDYNRGYIQHLLSPLGVRVVLLGFVEREQGLIVRKGNPKAVMGLADLLRPGVTYVNRQRGAGTRVLLDYQLGRAGIAPHQVQGYDHQEPTHLAVAAAVADGRGDCGLGVLAAARALGLDFVPLLHERFDLVVPVEHFNGPLLAPLIDLLRHPHEDFVAQIAALGGYATGSMGKVLAEM
jgi:molybdate-binding protein/predicted nucleic acid-binding protein